MFSLCQLCSTQDVFCEDELCHEGRFVFHKQALRRAKRGKASQGNTPAAAPQTSYEEYQLTREKVRQYSSGGEF